MLHNTLSSWNKKHLQLILVFFFLALVIPTVILISQAYSQLKWESFHHYRTQAEELSTRIDYFYKELIETESERSFTDYSYLNVAGNLQSKILQRSPLSSYPVNSKLPGIIGYFQIDNFGKFTTPLLPSTKTGKFTQSENYGITKNEKEQRLKIQNNIYQVLKQNKLINKLPIKLAEKKVSGLVAEEFPELENRVTPSDNNSSSGKIISPAPAQPATSAQPEPLTPRSIVASAAEQETIAPQAAFDKLQTQQTYTTTDKSNSYIKRKRRVEDLKLKKQYQRQSLKQERLAKKSKYKNEMQKASRRKERNILPQVDNKITSNAYKNDQAWHINMFESEIDEFEFSLLESGHFVLYRKVWRNGLRYIQGLLIKPDIFINQIIKQSFYKTSVSNASNLTVAYQGNILSTINRKSSRDLYSSKFSSQNGSELQGTLLLQNKLSGTLSQLELIFSVNNLPAGPGGTIINWLSVILLLILCGGFLALYILGLKQIKLARQQQDFVSAVSHELKTPLTSIRMYGEMLREGWTTEEKRNQYYDYIYDESERLTRLINNVLQLARMTRNELPVELKSHPVKELIDTTRSKISSQIERSEFGLNMLCNEDISNKSLLIDIDFFIQIIINLVDNAIKFSSKAEKKQIDIKCIALRNNKIQFSIRDYGPGINRDQMRKIFQLFYRSENELTRDTVGTGIGLSLVKQLVKSMYGSIDIIERDPGAEFQITFPTI